MSMIMLNRARGDMMEGGGRGSGQEVMGVGVGVGVDVGCRKCEVE